MLVPIESVYTTSYYSVVVIFAISCTDSEIFHLFVLMTAPIFHHNFEGVLVGLDRLCQDQFGVMYLYG